MLPPLQYSSFSIYTHEAKQLGLALISPPEDRAVHLLRGDSVVGYTKYFTQISIFYVIVSSACVVHGWSVHHFSLVLLLKSLVPLNSCGFVRSHDTDEQKTPPWSLMQYIYAISRRPKFHHNWREIPSGPFFLLRKVVCDSVWVYIPVPLVAKKELLTFRGRLYKEVTKTTSGTLVYPFERQTVRKKSSVEKQCPRLRM